MGRTRSFDSQDILERVTRLFWRNGYNGTSLQDLVEVTGLAKASIYNAFGNKEDLFHAALEYYILKKQRKLITLLTQEETGYEALQAYFSNILYTTTKNSQTPGCLLVNTAAERSMHDATVREIVDRGLDKMEELIANTIKAGIKDGSIQPHVDPEVAAFSLVTMIAGIRVMARKGIDPAKIEMVIKSNLKAHIPATPPTIQ